MASAAPPRPSADAKLRGELARAARSIRFADALGGVLALAAIALGYTAIMVAADRFADLPAWARGCGLGVALLAAASVSYFRVYLPLVRAVNPRYAARKVEAAAPGAKNAVINWVDLENEMLGETVRASLASRAASEVAAADTAKLSESRLVSTLLVACGILVALLAGLFLWLKPAPFLSLLTRAYNPFTVATIATRSEIVLDKPAGGDATLLAGDPLPVRVSINGRVPSADSPDRPRLLIRYTPDAAVPEEYPLPPGAGPREFAADLPAAVVQNGLWYQVAAGDARTPEYRVTVRPRPVITGYQVVATFPNYTRLKPEITTDPRIEALRGSEIELTVTGNRPLKDGQLRLTTQSVAVPAEPVPGAPEKLRFRFTVRDSGQYRVTFTTAEGEVGDPTASQQLLAIADARPMVTITQPLREEIALPITGRLAVDGLASDDFGVSAVSLKMQIAGSRPTLLEPVPYRPGKSLQRESDGSFPTRVEVKVSAAIGELKRQSGEAADVPVGAVIEYWLEAADNCTLPQSNLGRSKIQRVKLGPAPPPEQQANAKQQGERRQSAEQAHNQKQDEQFQNENREQQQSSAKPQDGKPEDKPKDAQPKQNGGQSGDKSNQTQSGEGSNGGNPRTNSGEKPPAGTPPKENSQPKQGDEGQKPQPNQDQKPGTENKQPGSGAQSQANKPPDQGQQPQANTQPAENTGETKPDAAPPGGQQTPGQPATAPQPPQQSEADKKLQAEAERVQDAANQAKNQQSQAGQKPSDAQREELAKAANDLANGTPEQKQAARQKLDDMVGKPNREQAEHEAEQIKNDLKSENNETREQAEQKVKDAAKQLQKQAGEKSASDAAQAARDLSSPDAKTREQAKQTLDKTVGQENREKLEQQANQSKADQQSGTESGQAKSDQKRDDMAKQAGEMAKRQSQAGGKPDAARQKEIQDAAKGLGSKDPTERKVAEDKLDKMVGKENRQAAQAKAEQLKNDLQSDDKQKREKAEKAVADMAKESGQNQPRPGGEGQKPDEQAVREAAKNLTSDDKGKRDAAKETLDNAVGEENRKKLEQQAQDIKDQEKAGGAGAQGKADQQKKELADKASEQAKLNQQGVKKPGTEESKPQNGTADSAPKPGGESGGQQGKPQGQPDQQPKMTDKPGQGIDPRKGEPKPANGATGLKQGNPEAGPKPGDSSTDGKPTGDAPKPSAEQQKELAKAAQDLATGTPREKEAARKKLDNAVGKDAREKAEADAKQLADDLKSGDPAKQKAAQQKMRDLQNQMAKQAGDKPQSGEHHPTPEEQAEWEQKAKDLAGDDPAKKQAAEKDFDKAIGEDARKELQQAQQQAKNGNQQSRDQAQKQAQRQAERAAKESAKRGGVGGKGIEREGDRLVENEKNRLKTAELQLADLEKIKSDPALQKRVGYTPEEYQAFLKSVRAAVDRQRAAVAKLEDEVKKSAGPAALNLGGSRTVTGQKGTTGGTGAGPGVPPPGFADALKRFGVEAAQPK